MAWSGRQFPAVTMVVLGAKKKNRAMVVSRRKTDFSGVATVGKAARRPLEMRKKEKGGRGGFSDGN